MGLTKNCTLLSQVTATYFEVTKIVFYPKQAQCQVDINGYISEEAMNEGAVPLVQRGFTWDTTGGTLTPAVLALIYSKLAVAIDEGVIK